MGKAKAKRGRGYRVLARRGRRAEVVRVAAGREVAFYAIDEFAPDSEYDGRAFRLTKLAAGKGGMWLVLRDDDGGAAVRDVFLARNGQDDHCSCRGCQRWGKCKHKDLVRALVRRGEV